MYIIIGLGNPGEEYKNTRHNTGAVIVEAFRRAEDFPDWKEDKKLKALISEGKIGKEKITLVFPETFMNKSGLSTAPLIKSQKAAEKLIVVHDDLDLPLGRMKISFNRGLGGHKGLESIKRAIKTEGFMRIRIGISPSTPSGKIKKPHGEDKVTDFILGKFKKSEEKVLKKIANEASKALAMIVTEGREKATQIVNQA